MTIISNLQQLGPVIRAARREVSLSQAQLALAAGINRYTVIKLETGRLTDVNYKTLVNVLGVLNLQLAVTEKRVTGLPTLGEPAL